MKKNGPKFGQCSYVLFATAIVAVIVFVPGYCQAQNTTLLLQQTPANGGTIDPGAGVHSFARDTSITLTATPQPGYSFVCWLGDVSDPRSHKTIANLNSPKIIIAVFERAEYSYLAPHENELWGSGGGGLRRPGEYYSQASGLRGYGSIGRSGFSFRRPRRLTSDPVPVPVSEPESDPVPVPVPEPATIGLLIFGGLLAVKSGPRGKRK